MKRFLTALLATLLLCCTLCTAVMADPGDYDKILDYVVTVDLRQDGSADITYDIDWQVLAGDKSEYLSWVKIGLANSYAEELTPLTDTIADISQLEEGGSYAKVVFSKRYYSPAVAMANGGESRVRFAFTVHQSHLFTRNGDGTASFAFTPGWFDDLCVDHMEIRWKNGEDFVADNTGTDGEYLTWEFDSLEHGQAATVHVTVPIATAGGYDAAHALTAADLTGGSDPTDRVFSFLLMTLLVVFLIVFLVVLLAASRSASWGGGFGSDLDPDDWYWYSNGTRTLRLLRTAPSPSGYRRVDPPKGFKAGGGSFRGGGSGRRSGGSGRNSGSCACVSSCACACASSCACACACAGGGRAGCSVKNFYAVKLPDAKEND